MAIRETDKVRIEKFGLEDTVLDLVRGLILSMRATAALLCAVATSLSPEAYADTHALLIGVSGYPTLPPRKRLYGPANDVQIMRASLLKSGVADSAITTLADGVSENATKHNIVTNLRGLAQRAKRGDWAIVYFSGHGSQQPQPQASKLQAGAYIEPDGLDEIFLPYDVGRWNSLKGSIDGVLTDDEIGREFERITHQGIKLWAIFDTCHAGGMGKSINLGSNAPVNRYLTPENLGVPPDALAAAYSASTKTSNASSVGIDKTSHAKATNNYRAGESNPMKNEKPIFRVHSGELVVFYASHPEEPTAEEALPIPHGLKLSGHQASGKPYFGVFTYLIAQAIPTWRGNFRQLADLVSQQYKVRPYPTPLFEGNLEVQPNFGPEILTKPK